jgi:hypothetical protein
MVAIHLSSASSSFFRPIENKNKKALCLYLSLSLCRQNTPGFGLPVLRMLQTIQKLATTRQSSKNTDTHPTPWWPPPKASGDDDALVLEPKAAASAEYYNLLRTTRMLSFHRSLKNVLSFSLFFLSLFVRKINHIHNHHSKHAPLLLFS